MVAPNDIRLKWVLADPSHERAVDALGMGSQADKIADFLLPQLSVVTRRARYFSFLCWAVRQGDGKLPRIHRLEAELAIEEARRHKDEPEDACPGVVGRRSALRHLEKSNGKSPVRPERLYKNKAFATYRPAMRSLGLLSLGRKPELTEKGQHLATIFAQSRGRKPRCLGDISVKERTYIKSLLGLDFRKQSEELPFTSKRRRATYEAVSYALETLSAASVLEQHAQIGDRSSGVASELHRAFVWELLSCGLTLAFSMLLAHERKSPVVNALRNAMSGAQRRPKLDRPEKFLATDIECGAYIVGLLRGALELKPKKLGLDQGPINVAERLVKERDPDDFLRQLVERHCMAKNEAPWVRLDGDKVRILVPEKCKVLDVRPRTYRLDAFRQLLRDLEMIP